MSERFTDIMSERFTEILRAASEPAWSDALGHRFVKELFAGAVPDAVMARYLIQDHRFLDSFLTRSECEACINWTYPPATQRAPTSLDISS